MKFVPLVLKPELSLSEDSIEECACLADIGFIDSEVKNGWLAASSISETLETYLEELVGEDVYSRFGRQFPLMVKMLSVKGELPVLVSPDDEVAYSRYDTLGKKKLWYVLEADEDARLFIGLSEDVSAQDFYKSCQDKTLRDRMNAVAPHGGEAYLIEPGTVHSASGHIVIAEVAESSDMDFKICGAGSTPLSETETLALEAVFDFIKFGKTAVAPLAEENGKLVAAREFTVNRLDLKTALRINTGTTDVFNIYFCVSGRASVQTHTPDGKTESVELKAHETVLVPAELTDFYLVPEDRDAVLLEMSMEPFTEDDKYIDPNAEAELKSGVIPS